MLLDSTAVSCQQVITGVLQSLFETTRAIVVNDDNITASPEVIAPFLVSLKQKFIPSMYKCWPQLISQGCPAFDALTQMILMMTNVPLTYSPFSSKEISEKFHEVLRRLTSDKNPFDYSLVISFLYNCLSGSERLFSGLDYQTQDLVVNVWLRAVIKGVYANDQIQWITSHLRHFTSFKSIVVETADSLPIVNDPYEFCSRLFQVNYILF